LSQSRSSSFPPPSYECLFLGARLKPERHSAERHSGEKDCVMVSVMLVHGLAVCRRLVYSFAERHSSKCHSAECRGAFSKMPKIVFSVKRSLII
jgi:hypothetical protein